MNSLNFFEAVEVCVKKYFDITGRASRSEYWWMFLFSAVIIIFFGVLGELSQPLEVVSYLVSFLIAIPMISVGIRRLHDINQSGRLILVPGIPFNLGALIALVYETPIDSDLTTAEIIGFFLFLVGLFLHFIFALEGKPEQNQFDIGANHLDGDISSYQRKNFFRTAATVERNGAENSVKKSQEDALLIRKKDASGELNTCSGCGTVLLNKMKICPNCGEFVRS